jgi:hypothetical protein
MLALLPAEVFPKGSVRKLRKGKAETALRKPFPSSHAHFFVDSGKPSRHIQLRYRFTASGFPCLLRIPEHGWFMAACSGHARLRINQRKGNFFQLRAISIDIHPVLHSFPFSSS